MRPARVLPLLLALGLFSCRTVIPPYPANALATVEGYKKVVEGLLGPLWYDSILVARGGTVGTVKLSFEIPAKGGRARHLKILASNTGDGDERIACDAVARLVAPPVPAEVLRSEHRDYLKLEESFTILEAPEPSPSPTSRKR
jgi:hypothetical protein